MGGWLAISVVHAWNEIALKFDLVVEFILAIAEAGSLLKTVPLLRSLTITMSPPFSLLLIKIIQFDTNWLWSWNLSVGSEAHWVRIRLLIVSIQVWNAVTILHLFVEIFVAGGEAGSLLHCVPFLRALTVSVGPPLII